MCAPGAEHDGRASRPPRRRGHGADGFSLIELMITVAIVGIITAIAYPNYRNYVLRSHRTDAVRALTLDGQILQRCYSQGQPFSFTNAACPAAGNWGNSANAYYAITEPVARTANTYTLQATAIGTQTADTTCASFTLNQAGQQTALDTGNADQSLTCWGSN